MGAQMVKEFASKTSDVAGDGTTTATVLAEAIFERGPQGWSPLARTRSQLKRGIEKPRSRHAVASVRVGKKSHAGQATQRPDQAQVGAISANQDKAIGDLLADAMEQGVGKDGVITVEEAQGMETEPRRRWTACSSTRATCLAATSSTDARDDAGRARGRLRPPAREEDRQPIK